MVRMMSPGLLRYLAGRLVRALLTVVGLVTIVFLLVRLIPGDPVGRSSGTRQAPKKRPSFVARSTSTDRLGSSICRSSGTWRMAAWERRSGSPIDRYGP
jgi:ABC-type microcin C transport system permease subunit YejB